LGDGNYLNEVKEYVQKNNIEVEFLYGKNNVWDYINESDVVIGMGRCILEALASKKIAILSGYEDIKGIVTSNIIQNSIKNNLSFGSDMNPISNDNVLNLLFSYTKEEIQKLTEENYFLIKEHFDLEKNIIYLNKNENSKIDINKLNTILINSLKNTIDEKDKQTNIANTLWKEIQHIKSSIKWKLFFEFFKRKT